MTNSALFRRVGWPSFESAERVVASLLVPSWLRQRLAGSRNLLVRIFYEFLIQTLSAFTTALVATLVLLPVAFLFNWNGSLWLAIPVLVWVAVGCLAVTRQITSKTDHKREALIDVRISVPFGGIELPKDQPVTPLRRRE